METNNQKSAESHKTDGTQNKSSSQSSSNSSKETSDTKTKPEETSMQDLLMHLLTGAGAVGGSYLLFIKPMQDKLDAMKKQIEEQDDRIDELEHRLKNITQKTKRETEDDEEDYFKVKNKNASQPLNGTRKRAHF